MLMWALCALYVVFLFNHLAHPDLQWKTPLECCYGVTPDISCLLMFKFWEPVFYYDHEASFPDPKEKLGRFVGFAENTGDALTFLVFTEDTQQVIARSVVR